MGTIPESVINDVRERVDVVALVGRDVELRKSGTRYIGLCPFHGERTASFTVDGRRGRWHCFGCEASGDAFAWVQQRRGVNFPQAVALLAAQVGVELPEGLPRVDVAALPAPSPIARVIEDDDGPPPPDPVDVPGGWAALKDARHHWQGRIEGWARERGLSPEMARALLDSGLVAAAPTANVGGAAQAFVDAIRWAPRDLFVALTHEGRVVDVERRYIRGVGAPPSKPKTARLDRRQTGDIPRPMFGELDAVIEVARAGGTVLLVEGSADWMLAYGACAEREACTAIGGPSHGSLPHVATAITLAVRDAFPRIKPGSWEICVVPHMGDKGRVGERSAWSAAVRLCDVARVRWCPPVRREYDAESKRLLMIPLDKGDLCDVLPGQPDAAAAVWQVIELGRQVLETLDPKDSAEARRQTLERWRRADDDEVRRAFYRLPLSEVIEVLHWIEPRDDDGQPKPPVRMQKVLYRGMQSGPTRLSDMALRWLDHHGVTFVSAEDGKGQYLFDATDRASLDVRPRGLPRLVKVGSKSHWEGWLQAIGWINPADPSGKLLERALRQAAQRATGAELRPWLTASGKLSDPVVRLHLHERNERVVRVAGGAVEVVPNRGASLLIASRHQVAPIEWLDGVDGRDLAWQLWHLVGRHLTVTDSERAMAVCWLLLAPLRELIRARPMAWSTGPAGSGKSLLAKLLTTFVYGDSDPGIFTSAALWEVGRMWPLVCMDNAERRFLTDDDEQFLLTASTGTGRHRRSSESDWGVVLQSVRTLVHMSAIGRPWNPELQRRTLLLQHEKRYRARGEFRESEVLDALRSARSALWTGTMRLYAERITPALREATHHRLAAMVPEDNPLWEMREALGSMALIGDALHKAAPVWAMDGPALIGSWSAVIEERIRETRRVNDPLGTALDHMLREWNRVEVDPYCAGAVLRPAIHKGLFACKPVFMLAPKLRAGLPEGAEPWTLDIERAEKDGDHIERVVGVRGTYPELHFDLMKVMRDPEFRSRYPTPDEIRHTIGMVEGWKGRMVKRRGPRGLRIHQWTQAQWLEDEESAS